MPVDLSLGAMSVEDLIVESSPRMADVSIVKGRNHVLLQLITPILNENPKVFRIDCVEALKGSLTLVVKLKTGGELNNNILIGEVRVIIKDLMDQIDGEKSYFTYPITAPSGKVTIGALKFSVEFKELVALADTAAGNPYMGPTHAQGYASLSPTPPYNPPYPAPQPRRPSISQRLATHLGLTFLTDSMMNGFDFDPEFGDFGSFF